MSDPVAPVPAPGGDAPAPEPAAPTPTPDEQAQQAEDAEWDAASKETFPGAKSKNKEKGDEPAEPKKDGEKTPEGKENPDDKKPDAEQGAGDEAKPKDETAKDPAAVEREARATARATAQQVEAVKSDVRAKMFADVPRTLQDADGDPINSIDDVMKLINPRTGNNFTDEEAGMWLLSAQQQFNQKIAEVDRTINDVAELNLDIKDQADSVIAKYGDWLKNNPEKRDEIWTEYQKTLVKHPESELVLHAPVRLEWFYDQTLGPVINAAASAPPAAAPPAPDASPEASGEAPAAQADPAQAAADEEAAKKKAAKDAEEAKKKKRADRSDIYGGSNMDTRDDDTKEWDEAIEATFPNYKK